MKINDTIHGLKFQAVYIAHNGCIEIGKNCSMGNVDFYLYQRNTSINIGEDCMFSDGIIVQSHDGHKILNNSTGNLIIMTKII